MNEFATLVGETFCDLQASHIAMTRMLRAIIATHPDPKALRDAWHRYAAMPVVEAEIQKAADPSKMVATQALLDELQQWNSILEEDLSGA